MDLQQQVAALEKRVRDLEARDAIHDVLARYAWTIDTEDWAGFGAIYAEDAVLDHSRWRATQYKGREAIVTFGKQHRARMMNTNRMVLNERISVTGDTAKAEAYFLYMYNRDGDSWIGWGNYRWELRNIKGAGLITRMTLLPNTITTLAKGWGMETGRLPEAPPLGAAK